MVGNVGGDNLDILTYGLLNKKVEEAKNISGEKITEAVNTYLDKNPVAPGATAEQAEQIQDNTNKISELKSDLSNKITKFYASSQGETHLIDSDNGKIMDMMIYGKSSQDGVPTPENPVEIKSVVNPTVKITGKNLLNATLQTTTINGITCTANGDGTYTLNGTATTRTELWVIGGYNNNIKIPLNPTKKYVLKGTGYVDIQMHAGTANNTIVSANGKDINLTNMAGLAFVLLIIDSGFTANNLIIYPQLEEGFTSTTYEHHDEQTVTLPYTLNAIPVGSGSNVTIDGKKYVADYVDIENKKLVRMVDMLVLDGSELWELQSINDYNIANFVCRSIRRYKMSIASNRLPPQKSLIANTKSEGIYVNENYMLFIRLKTDRISTTDALKTWLSENNIVALTALYKPTTIDLTDEEFLAFKALTTHYPTTNVNVTSDQLDGYTTFNYPLNMKNGWDYIKEQLGDTREYIYDMELQSAEAYVNSEYAVTLTELGV